MSPPEFYMQVPGKLRPSRLMQHCRFVRATAAEQSLAYMQRIPPLL